MGMCPAVKPHALSVPRHFTREIADSTYVHRRRKVLKSTYVGQSEHKCRGRQEGGVQGGALPLPPNFFFSHYCAFSCILTRFQGTTACLMRYMLSPVRLSVRHTVTRVDQSTRSQAVARIADRTAKNCRGHVIQATPTFRVIICAPPQHSQYKAAYQI